MDTDTINMLVNGVAWAFGGAFILFLLWALIFFNDDHDEDDHDGKFA
jgi:hypothetical protein